MTWKNFTRDNYSTPKNSVFCLSEDKNLSLVKDIVLVLGFALLTGVSAKIKMEIGAVPITMQTLTVLLSAGLLGKKRATLSQITYFLGGLIGIPWFSRGGGMIYIMSPTFGYIIGFIVATFLIGSLWERGWNKSFGKITLTILLGGLVIYIPGLSWLSNFIGVSKVLTVGFYPFILGDLLKVFLATLILYLRLNTV
jgi:biotin transporter BioY